MALRENLYARWQQRKSLSAIHHELTHEHSVSTCTEFASSYQVKAAEEYQSVMLPLNTLMVVHFPLRLQLPY